MTTYTTLNKILKCNPCGRKTNGDSGFSKLLKHLNKTEADDEPLSFITILESNGILDAKWCLRTLPDYDLKVMEFKLKCARRVEHLDGSGAAKACLDVLAGFIDGNATKDELRDAATAAADANADANAAAAYAATAAAYADAADAAAYAAANADADATDADATDAATDAEREYQTQIFREIFG